MKKLRNLLTVFIAVVVMMTGGVLLAACNAGVDLNTKPDDSTQPDKPVGISTTRYIASPVDAETNEIPNHRLDYSFKFISESDKVLYDAYYTYLGKVEWVPIAANMPEYYNGMTPIELTYSTTQTTQASFSESMSYAVTSSTQTVRSNTHTKSIEGTAKVTWIPLVAEATIKGGYSHAEFDSTAKTEQTSRTDSWTVFQGESISNTQAATIPLGTKGEPAGFYRYSLFATCDVYVTLVHNLANDEWAYEYSFFARPLSFFRSIDYSVDNDFSISTDGSDLKFDTALVSTLSVIPSQSFVVKFVSNGVTLKTQAVTYGSFATPPAIPTSSTHNFDGWDINPATTLILQDRTFTAKWKAKQWVQQWENSKGVAVQDKVTLNIANQTGKAIPSYGSSVRISYMVMFIAYSESAGVIVLNPSGSYYINGKNKAFDYTFTNGTLVIYNFPTKYHFVVVTKIEYFI